MVLNWSLMVMNLIMIDINVEIYQMRCGGGGKVESHQKMNRKRSKDRKGNVQRLIVLRTSFTSQSIV
jgi:hypothetical protein